MSYNKNQYFTGGGGASYRSRFKTAYGERLAAAAFAEAKFRSETGTREEPAMVPVRISNTMRLLDGSPTP